MPAGHVRVLWALHGGRYTTWSTVKAVPSLPPGLTSSYVRRGAWSVDTCSMLSLRILYTEIGSGLLNFGSDVWVCQKSFYEIRHFLCIRQIMEYVTNPWRRIDSIATDKRYLSEVRVYTAIGGQP
jgi:hypothetical protein